MTIGRRWVLAAIASLIAATLAGACKSSGGAGGSTSATSTTGATSTATGSTGTGAICKANSADCDTCITVTSCKAQLTACAADMACSAAVNTAENCVCLAQDAFNQSQQTMCSTTLAGAGMLAAAVNTCITSNCKAQCLI